MSEFPGLVGHREDYCYNMTYEMIYDTDNHISGEKNILDLIADIL